MNKSKNAEEQKAIQELIERLQQSLEIVNFELGSESCAPKFIRHDGRTWSISMFGKKFILKIEIQ